MALPVLVHAYIAVKLDYTQIMLPVPKSALLSLLWVFAQNGNKLASNKVCCRCDLRVVQPEPRRAHCSPDVSEMVLFVRAGAYTLLPGFRLGLLKEIIAL